MLIFNRDNTLFWKDYHTWIQKMGSSLGSMNLLAMCLGKSISIEELQLFSHLYLLMLLMRIEIMKARAFG